MRQIAERASVCRTLGDMVHARLTCGKLPAQSVKAAENPELSTVSLKSSEINGSRSKAFHNSAMKELSDRVKTSRELAARGISHTRVRTYCAQGVYAKIAPNSYCLTREWNSLTPEQQLKVRHYAFAKNHPGYVLSHASAALFWGAPFLSLPGHIWASVPSAHIRARTPHHKIFSNRAVECERALLHEGVYLTDPLQTSVDCARTLPLIEALCIVDYMLNSKLCSPAALKPLLMNVSGRGAARARQIAQRMSRHAASPAETIARNHMIDWKFPRPQEQAKLVVKGKVYRPDFLWEELKLILEVDGAIKYDGTYGEPTGVIQREHLRQRELEQLGYVVVRVRWDDITAHPENLKDLLMRHGLKPVT